MIPHSFSFSQIQILFSISRPSPIYFNRTQSPIEGIVTGLPRWQAWCDVTSGTASLHNRKMMVGGASAAVSRQCAADIGRVSTVVCSASNERMTTRWQCCASAVLVIVLVVSDRVATAKNQIVEHRIRDDPDLSEVRLIFKHFQLHFYLSAYVVL